MFQHRGLAGAEIPSSTLITGASGPKYAPTGDSITILGRPPGTEWALLYANYKGIPVTIYSPVLYPTPLPVASGPVLALDTRYLLADPQDPSEAACLLAADYNSSQQGILILTLASRQEAIVSRLREANLPLTTILNRPEVVPGKRIAVVTLDQAATWDWRDYSVLIDLMVEAWPVVTPGGGGRIEERALCQGHAELHASLLSRGICHRMISRETYDKTPVWYEDTRPLCWFLVRFPEPLAVIDTVKAREEVQLLNRLQVKSETFFAFPFSVRSTAILSRWIAGNYPLFPCLVILSFLDTGGGWYHRNTQRNLALRGINDIDSFLLLWASLTEFLGGISGEVRQWCKQNGVTCSMVETCLSRVREVVGICGSLGWACQVGRFTREGVLEALVPILHEVYRDREVERMGDKYVHVPTSATYRLDNNGFSDLLLRPPERLLAIQTKKLSSATWELITVAV